VIVDTFTAYPAMQSSTATSYTQYLEEGYDDGSEQYRQIDRAIGADAAVWLTDDLRRLARRMKSEDDPAQKAASRRIRALINAQASHETIGTRSTRQNHDGAGRQHPHAVELRAIT
jgi:hypothetical protein